MSSAERYRRYASECLKLAQLAATDADKGVLLQMAEMWRRLAERFEVRSPETDNQNE
jgi:hypothetical protein